MKKQCSYPFRAAFRKDKISKLAKREKNPYIEKSGVRKSIKVGPFNQV